ncbi:MAG: glycoside hydrolase family 5 protein [Janthinobacterium lividum]
MKIIRSTHAVRHRSLVWTVALFAALGMCAAITHTAESAARVVPPPFTKAAMLPSGYLSTRGSQIIDSHGRPVRLASIGGFGTCVSTGGLDYSYGAYLGLDTNIAALKRLGFNCIRADFNDKNVGDPAMMAQFDQLVAACKKYGVKVIFDHHNNEATPADWGNAAQQTNGLWFDTGPGSDGTDGAHDTGTISREKFQQDWVTMARHWAGDSTVIGFDLDNEPHTQYGHNTENWGQGGPCDIWAMFTTVGSAIQAVDPGVLIICEGPMDVTDKNSIIWWMMDLTPAATKPVVLPMPHKLVYSVHEYPNLPNDSGPALIARLNKDWGFLERQNIAPVWIGEMGASMDVEDGGHTSVAEQSAWGRTLLSYMNGSAPDGPRFPGNQQGISGDWWRWGCLPGQTPDGCLDTAGRLRPLQSIYIEQMLFLPK